MQFLGGEMEVPKRENPEMDIKKSIPPNVHGSYAIAERPSLIRYALGGSLNVEKNQKSA